MGRDHCQRGRLERRKVALGAVGQQQAVIAPVIGLAHAGLHAHFSRHTHEQQLRDANPTMTEFTPEAASELFEKGEVPKRKSQLMGDWILTGHTTTSNNLSSSYPDGYCPTGIVNLDGYQRAIEFSLKTEGDDFADDNHDSSVTFAVSYLNMSYDFSKHPLATQGPSKVFFDDASTQFNQYYASYYMSTHQRYKINKNLRFRYGCKLLAADDMICSLTAVAEGAVENDYVHVYEKYEQYNHQIVLYDRFKRVSEQAGAVKIPVMAYSLDGEQP